MEIQTWYVAIDVNDELMAMFLNKFDLDSWVERKEDVTGLPYTKEEYQLKLKR